MKYLVITVILLQLVNLVFSVSILARDNITTFDVYRTLELSCRLTETSPDIKVAWEKDGTPVGKIEKYTNKLKFSESSGNFTFSITKTDDDDAGNYSCVAYENEKELSRANILASSNIRIKMQSNLNVVQGEKLRIVCHASGRPKPIISWIIGNETYTESRGIVKLLKDEQTDTENAILLMENINITDRGVYKCKGTSEITHKSIIDETMVRIKDKYAALWPFLGICLEVFVLCAIILIYEKKRNKSELEESDTDQSPDQKNTPDHGKDSNLRHRQ